MSQGQQNDFRVMWKGLCDFLLLLIKNLGSISHRFLDTASFPLKTHIFYLIHFTSTVPPALNRLNFAGAELPHQANYSHKKFCRKTYHEATIHPWQTDRRQTFHSIGPISWPMHPRTFFTDTKTIELRIYKYMNFGFSRPFRTDELVSGPLHIDYHRDDDCF